MSTPPKVTISTHTKSLTFRFAEGLAARGALERIYTIYPRFKLAEYRIPPELVTSYALFGALKYANIRLGRLPGFDDWNSTLFGKVVAWNLRKPAGPWIFHGLSGYCEAGLRKAKRQGGVAVIERGCPHIDFQEEQLAEEQSRLLGRTVPRVNDATDARMKREYEIADYIFVPSRYSRQTFLDRGFSPAKVIAVPHCNEKATTPPAGPKKLDKFTVLCVAGHFYRKGVFYLLQAWKELALKDAELVLRSDIPKEFPELRNLPNVRYVGHVSDAEIVGMYQKAHIMVFPSIDDGFGLVVIEALRAGLPVIVTNHVGAGEILEEGKDGFVVPIRDVGALKDRIRFLYDRPAKVEAMGAAAALKAEQYTLPRFIDRMLAAYTKLV